MINSLKRRPLYEITMARSVTTLPESFRTRYDYCSFLLTSIRQTKENVESIERDQTGFVLHSSGSNQPSLRHESAAYSLRPNRTIYSAIIRS